MRAAEAIITIQATNPSCRQELTPAQRVWLMSAWGALPTTWLAQERADWLLEHPAGTRSRWEEVIDGHGCHVFDEARALSSNGRGDV